MRRSSFLLLFLVLFAASGCDRRDAEEPARSPAAERAAVYACFGEELARTTEDEVDTIEGSMPAADDQAPMQQVRRQAQRAALEFARAMHQHALLRHGAYAYTDSALNHATGAGDSLRYEQSAERYTILAPQPGTVEANVFSAYERRLAALLRDDDHPCHWDR